MMSRALNRRTLLRGAGGAAIALPLLDAMLTTSGLLPGAGTARAAEPPKRLILFFTGNGLTMSNWKCTPSGADGRTFALSPILQPLAPIQSDCVFVEGLTFQSALDAASPAGGHVGGATALFTGAYCGVGSMYAGGSTRRGGPPVLPSIDDEAAKVLGGGTRFPSYHLGVMPNGAQIMHRAFYGPNATIINPNGDPWAVFTQLFADLATPGSATGASNGDALRRRIAEKKSILDLVMPSYQSLGCKLGGDDKARLDQHLTHLRSIESRLDNVGSAAPTPGCAKPSLPVTKIDATTFSNMPTIGPLQIDLAVMALRCDLTRVVGLQWHCSDTENSGIYSWLGEGHDISHHDITHGRGSNPDAAKLSAARYHATQVATIWGKLKDAAEGAGSIASRTVLLWGTEIRNDNTAHAYDNVPWTIVGNAGGAWQTGRYLKMPANTAHNRLLLNALHAIGSTKTSVGVAQYSEGGALPL